MGLQGKNLLVSGDNSYGQLGNGLSDYYPDFVIIAENVVSVSAGKDHVLFEDISGDVWLLGLNMVGSTEVAPDLEFGQVYENPVLVATDVTYYEVNLYWNFFRFKGDNRLYSSGYSSRGINGFRTSPTIFDDGLTNIVDVSSTFEAALFLDANGNLYGLGNSFNLGLPLGQSSDPKDPLLLEEGILRAEMSINFPTYLHESGELRRYKIFGGYEVIDTGVSDFSIGNNAQIYYINKSSILYSRSGEGEEKTHYSDNVRSVINGRSTMFYITHNDELWASGENITGLMGKGNFEKAEVAVFIRNGVKSMAMNDETLYIVDANGDLLGAGYNGKSRLGKPLAGASLDLIVQASGDFLKIEAGYQTTYFIEESGDLYGLGRNDFGQLGQGDTNLYAKPQLIASSVVDIAVGGGSIDGRASFAAFVDESSNLWGVGSNQFNQISDSGGMFHRPQLIDVGVKSVRSGDLDVAYLRNDNTLWAQGEGFSGLEMIAEDVVKFDSGAIVVYIDSEGNLKTKESGFISSYKNENNISYDEEVLEITIDTNVVELAVGFVAVAYIKEDGGLYLSGARGFIGDGNYVVEPLLLDADVVRLSYSRYALMYQKSDSSVWLLAGSLDFYPPGFDEVSDDAVQVWENLMITDFAAGETNVLYVAESTEPPRVDRVSSSNKNPAHFRQPVDLNARVFGGYSEFFWYVGEVGDRSNPIESSSLRTTVYPNRTTSYWLEVSGQYGTARSSEVVRVEIALPEYGDWVMNSGLAIENAAYGADPDGDSNPNLLEFFYNLDPFSYDTNPWRTEFNRDNKTINFVLPKINAPEFTLVFQSRNDESSGWLPAADNPNLKVTESENSLVVTISSNNIDSLRLRLKVELD